jgi:hypothetical protein
MRLPQLVRVGEELYEIIYKCPVTRFSIEITGGAAEDLKKWFGAEKILRNPQTNEYLFVNLISEAEIITND